MLPMKEKHLFWRRASIDYSWYQSYIKGISSIFPCFGRGSVTGPEYLDTPAPLAFYSFTVATLPLIGWKKQANHRKLSTNALNSLPFHYVYWKINYYFPALYWKIKPIYTIHYKLFHIYIFSIDHLNKWFDFLAGKYWFFFFVDFSLMVSRKDKW